METKIKVTATVIKKQTDKYTIREITAEDGKKYDTFDDLKEGEEYSGIITPNANPAYNSRFQQSKPEGAKKMFGTPKDWTFEKKRAALQCAIDSVKLTEKTVTTDNIIAVADKYFTFLNQK